MHKNLEVCSGSSTTSSMYFDLFLELHLNPQGTPKQHIFDIKKSVPEDRQLHYDQKVPQKPQKLIS